MFSRYIYRYNPYFYRYYNTSYVPYYPSVPYQTIPTGVPFPTGPAVPGVPTAPGVPSVPATPTVPVDPPVVTLPASDDKQYCIDLVNDYRRAAGIPELVRDGDIDKYAQTAAEYDAQTGRAHSYFNMTRGGGVVYAENSLPGWPIYGSDIRPIIKQGLQSMYNEGPRGGHHVNMMNRSYTKIGCGIVITANNRLWLVNNFR